MSRSYEVLCGDVLVGHLVEDQSGLVTFRISESYRRLRRRPVLSQSFEDDLERVYRPKNRSQLPSFFANLIPEGSLRTLIERQSSIETGDDLALLEVVGADLPGATIIRRSSSPDGRHKATRIEKAHSPSEASATGELRFSLAGVQLKFSVIEVDDRLTLPARGDDGTWIAKIDSTSYPGVVANEFSMLRWAEEIGFEVPARRMATASEIVGLPVEIAEQDLPVLLVRRFDRNGARTHQEDFAQVVGFRPDLKYDHVSYGQLAVLIGRIAGREAVDEFLRRLAFIVASGNADAHLKNWSLLYRDPVHPKLSPVYDQVATVCWPTLARALALKLGGVKDFVRIDERALERFATAANLTSDAVMSTMSAVLDEASVAWGRVGPDLPLEAEHRAELAKHWTRVPLLRQLEFPG